MMAHKSEVRKLCIACRKKLFNMSCREGVFLNERAAKVRNQTTIKKQRMAVLCFKRTKKVLSQVEASRLFLTEKRFVSNTSNYAP